MNGRIRFYDATLTEGLARERLTPEQRTQLARELDASHVDFVEIGMVVAHNGHLETHTMVEGFHPQHAQAAYQVVLSAEGGETPARILDSALASDAPVITPDERSSSKPRTSSPCSVGTRQAPGTCSPPCGMLAWTC